MRTCSRCHLSEPEVSFGAKGFYCRPCNAEKHRQWVKDNPDKAKAIQRRGSKKWEAKNKPKRTAKDRIYREKNREKLNAKQRERRKNEDPAIARERLRKWQKANPEKRKASSKRDYEKRGRKYQKDNREQVNAWGRKWYWSHREQANAKFKKWAMEHPDDNRERVRRWTLEHPEQAKQTTKEWKRKNPGKVAANKQRRYAKEKGAEGSHTFEEWTALLAEHDYKCAYGGEPLTAKNATRDHKIPLSRGGGNAIANIVPACISCNSRKGTKTHDEFLLRPCLQRGH